MHLTWTRPRDQFPVPKGLCDQGRATCRRGSARNAGRRGENPRAGLIPRARSRAKVQTTVQVPNDSESSPAGTHSCSKAIRESFAAGVTAVVGEDGLENRRAVRETQREPPRSLSLYMCACMRPALCASTGRDANAALRARPSGARARISRQRVRLVSLCARVCGCIRATAQARVCRSTCYTSREFLLVWYALRGKPLGGGCGGGKCRSISHGGPTSVFDDGFEPLPNCETSNRLTDEGCRSGAN